MKKIVIFGAGDIAELAHFYFEKQGKFKVCAFVVDDEFCKETQFCRLPLVPLSRLTTEFPASQYGAFVAVSYAKMNRLREQKFLQLRTAGYEMVSYVSPHCTNFAAEIGQNCFILEDNTLQPFSKIGDNVTLWSGNHVGHHSQIKDNCFITSHVVISGGVTIERNSFIGVNSTLRDHITIGEFSMIGAGTLVTKNTEPRQVLRAPRSEVLDKTSDQLQKI